MRSAPTTGITLYRFIMPMKLLELFLFLGCFGGVNGGVWFGG
jgi:hypothetical protein